MELNDNTIVTFSPSVLLQKETFLSLMDVQDPIEKMRLQTLLESQAKKYGILSEFKNIVDAFNALEKRLSEEFEKENINKNGIDLAFDSRGSVLNITDNYLRIIESDRKFAGLKFNLLTYSPEKEKDGEIVKWTDADDAEARRYIEKKYSIHSVQKCDDALRIVFARNEYHPVRDIVDKLQWDGKSRIFEFLVKWTKCEDSAYTREVSRLIFAGGIHRLYNPGCKFDDMPVLIGTKQGEGKSTLVRWLALRDEYFTEVNEFEGQRGIEAVEGAWICEVSELLAMTKTKEQEAVKSYLTRLNDRYRMPFDKRVTDHPRQCVFIGTTNKEQFLTDKTGNRRFYPVKVNQNGYDLFDHEDEIKEYIRQCWAEAREMFFRGELHNYADRALIEEIREKQQDAVEDDYRVGLIVSYLENKRETCVLDLWKNALGNDFTKPTKKESNEIGIIMQSIPEFVKQDGIKRFPEFGVQRWWKREKAIEQMNIFDNNESENDLKF